MNPNIRKVIGALSVALAAVLMIRHRTAEGHNHALVFPAYFSLIIGMRLLAPRPVGVRRKVMAVGLAVAILIAAALAAWFWH